MLDALGPEYLLQHIAEAWRTACRDRAYRAYLAENLRVIGENTAKFVGGGYMEASWQEPEDNPWKEETRSPDEIITDITAKLRGDTPE